MPSDNCAICLEGLHNDLGVAVPCGHVFHRPCFAFLKQSICAECHGSESSANVIIPCPVCKRHVKRFRKLYLTYQEEEKVESSGSTSSSSTAIQLTRENIRLQKRLRELKTLSNDQSDLLFRILPRYDHMESRHDKLKRDKVELQKHIQHLNQQHCELVHQWTSTEERYQHIQDQQRQLLNKLEDVNAENKDLHDIWDTLETQLNQSMEKRRSIKQKLKLNVQERDLQLEMMKSQCKQLKQQKKAFKVALRQSQEQVHQLQIKLHNANHKKSSSRREKKKQNKSKRNKDNFVPNDDNYNVFKMNRHRSISEVSQDEMEIIC